MSHVSLIAIVLVVVAVVIVIVFVLSVIVLRPHADITINVYSTHILFSVEYTLYIDGIVYDTGTIDAGYYVTYDYTHSWSSGDSTVVHFSATSTGGGFGSESDSAYITVSDGGAYLVSLYI
jgi:hypothetical protein